MPYVYSDPRRESETYSLPDVEILCITAGEIQDLVEAEEGDWFDQWENDGSPDVADWAKDRSGWYYVYGFPGCLWDGTPMGPYETSEAALEACREDADLGDDEEEGDDDEGVSEPLQLPLWDTGDSTPIE